MKSVGYETYQLGNSDFGPALQRLKAARPDMISIFGLSGDTANFVIQIDQLGSAYVDTPTAKDPSKGWHPHIFGSPGGTGDHSWADLAKDSAKPGTITAWHVGGLVYLPEFAIAGWMKKYLDKLPTGGEESPADGLYTLLKGVEKAGTTDRVRLVQAIETQGPLKFASSTFSFTADRHLNKTPDDMIIVTLERKGGEHAFPDGCLPPGTRAREDYAAAGWASRRNARSSTSRGFRFRSSASSARASSRAAKAAVHAVTSPSPSGRRSRLISPASSAPTRAAMRSRNTEDIASRIQSR